IRSGSGGSCLSHSHATQYQFTHPLHPSPPPALPSPLLIKFQENILSPFVQGLVVPVSYTLMQPNIMLFGCRWFFGSKYMIVVILFPLFFLNPSTDTTD